MSLEEKLRAYATKGELVHLSLVFSASGAFECTYTAASPAGGYAFGRAADPVEAIEKALKASPAKPVRVSKPKEEVTAAVNEVADHLSEGGTFTPVALSREWTTP